MGAFTYETIGAGYARYRAADPRLVEQIIRLLSLPQGSTVIDVGAGTGSYAGALAARGYPVIAVEPAALMRKQARPTSGVHWLAGTAEALPLATGAGCGLLCMLALHHMRSIPVVVQEMRRVVPEGPLIIFTFDPRCSEPWWFDTYFPTIWRETFRVFPSLDQLVEQMHSVAGHSVEIVPFLLPADLVDRFAAAGWRRPEMYLDPATRAGMSAFALADQGAVEDGVARLTRDLASGEWHRRFTALSQRHSFDAGYRFLVIR